MTLPFTHVYMPELQQLLVIWAKIRLDWQVPERPRSGAFEFALEFIS